MVVARRIRSKLGLNTMTHPLGRPELVSGSHGIKSMMCSDMQWLCETWI
jgi:hypothetical protein